MEAMIMFMVGAAIQAVFYAVTAFLVGLALSVGWHLGKKAING